ncbi:hypothetical protein [Pseudoleptotrichia goodfellowii]|uniref:Uncharacterized protein n=1 Tax=Pseudoleptotrichia goodfellowii TaxID=157692 RepID=A0A510JCX7_9FUSO|nr:hypothetical protein [Pseudoleptotrichia goodfellowii]BBM37158.1 hypothetical protein JCM16774_2117 [Pseudoleptotrichia goodfellowii]
MNFPNGSRAYVDNQTIFILGEGSNLTIGKVENTAGIIGVEGNGKLKINEYKGTDLYNHDNLTTTGGSIGVDFGKGGAKVNGVGVNNESHRKEGITRHTVIGNVEIGSATGSPINRDRSKANETTKDTHRTTNINIESQTIEYATNPKKFKEDLGKSKDEINDIGRAIKESLNDRGDDNRNFLGQLSEGRLQRTIENIGGERLRKSTTQEDISKTLKDTYKDLGYDVNIIFTTPDKAPQLIDEKGKIKAGTAYVGKDGKHTIIINTEAKENQDRAGLIGTITEEGSHVIGKVEGRQRKVPEGSEEKGLESTGRATNDFFNKTYEEGNIPIQTKSDGKDYSKADFGEHVGDKRNEGWGAMFFNNSLLKEKKSDGTTYKKTEIERELNSIFGLKVDWKKYEEEGPYREEINYYFFQAKYTLRVKSVGKPYTKSNGNTYIKIIRNNGSPMELKMIPENESVYHNLTFKNGEIAINFKEVNRKYVQDDGYEFIVNSKGEQLKNDPKNMGTYNFYTYGSINIDAAQHGITDVGFWKKYGTAPKGIDPTTKEQREKIGAAGVGLSLKDDYQYYKEASQHRNGVLTYSDIKRLKENMWRIKEYKNFYDDRQNLIKKILDTNKKVR